MEEMGMTDKQFNAFLRILLENLKEAKEEIETSNKVDKLDKTIENIQKTLES